MLYEIFMHIVPLYRRAQKKAELICMHVVGSIFNLPNSVGWIFMLYLYDVSRIRWPFKGYCQKYFDKENYRDQTLVTCNGNDLPFVYSYEMCKAFLIKSV